jgi:hypothetical protein
MGPKIALEQAFSWECPKCGNKNYCDPVAPVIDSLKDPESFEETEQALKAFGHLEEWESLEDNPEVGYDVVVGPKDVQCIFCQSEFEATLDTDEEDLDVLE